VFNHEKNNQSEPMCQQLITKSRSKWLPLGGIRLRGRQRESDSALRAAAMATNGFGLSAEAL
jgi:hypothetical protein